MVGNISELQNPTSNRAQPAIGPAPAPEASSIRIAAEAKAASTLPGLKRRSRAAPMKRPIRAPPQ